MENKIGKGEIAVTIFLLVIALLTSFRAYGDYVIDNSYEKIRSEEKVPELLSYVSEIEGIQAKMFNLDNNIIERCLQSGESFSTSAEGTKGVCAVDYLGYNQEEDCFNLKIKGANITAQDIFVISDELTLKSKLKPTTNQTKIDSELKNIDTWKKRRNVALFFEVVITIISLIVALLTFRYGFKWNDLKKLIKKPK